MVPKVLRVAFGRIMTKDAQQAIQHLNIIFQDLGDRKFVDTHPGKDDRTFVEKEGLHAEYIEVVPRFATPSAFFVASERPEVEAESPSAFSSCGWETMEEWVYMKYCHWKSASWGITSSSKGWWKRKRALITKHNRRVYTLYGCTVRVS